MSPQSQLQKEEINSPLSIVKGLLAHSSCVRYCADSEKDGLYILKRKVVGQKEDQRARFAYEVVDEGNSLNRHLFEDTEMEYARDTAIAFFVMLVRASLVFHDNSELNLTTSLREMIAN